HSSEKDSEFSEILVESPDAKDQSVTGQDTSPLEGKRAFEHMAEENVVRKLERVGLLAPSGEIDKVLQTVVNNLEITNKLDIQPEIRCRVLLTTPLESFAVGHTIIMSRGLIDVLPDEASLALVLSRELAHIALGHNFDTRYAFSDRIQFSDEKTYHNLAFGHTPQEEQEADKKADELLKNSPYADKLAGAGLFLRALDSRAQALGALNQARLGTSLVENNHVARMAAVMNSAPQLELQKVDQIAALPLGGRVKLNPWTNTAALVKTAPMPITSAADKMPFEVTPFLPFIQRAGSATDTSVASTGAAKSPEDK
ncbi:MAG: M48 family metalloprotease, partial [Acidobacteria bacterium]|nr:M48 family metalloprotease [Acidobacteriota bacterium]